MQTATNIQTANTTGSRQSDLLPGFAEDSAKEPKQFIDMMQQALAAGPRRDHAGQKSELQPPNRNPHAHLFATHAACKGALRIDSADVDANDQEVESAESGVAETKKEVADSISLLGLCVSPVALPTIAEVTPPALAPCLEASADVDSGSELVEVSPVDASPTPPVATSVEEPVPPLPSGDDAVKTTAAPVPEMSCAASEVAAAPTNPWASGGLPAPAKIAGPGSVAPAMIATPKEEEMELEAKDISFEAQMQTPTKAAPDGPEVHVQTPAENVVAPRSEPDGTGAAQGAVVMKKAEHADKFAAPEKEVPGADSSAASATFVAPTSEPRPARASHHEASSFLNPTPAEPSLAHPTANEATSVEPAMNHRNPAIEQTHELVTAHALRMRHVGSEAMQVTLKPGNGLELSLQLSQRGGVIEARAEVQTGDFDHLSRHWSDLQQRLEGRGIRLAPLTSANQWFGGDANSSQHQNGRAFRENTATGELLPAFNLASVSAKGTTSRAVRVSARGWESWA